MAQVIPTTDTLNVGPGPTSSGHCMYFRVKPWTGAEAVTGFSLNTQAQSYLYSAWWTQTAWNQPNRNAAITTDTGTPGEYHGAFVFRNAVATDLDVSCGVWTYFSSLTTSEYSTEFGTVGIGARIAGGSIQNSGTVASEHIASLNGYWFLLACDSLQSTGLRYCLLRVNAGTPTLLASWPTSPATRNPATEWSLGRPIRLRMTVTTNGSTEEIRCYVAKFWSAHTSGPPGVDQLVISYDDTGGSRLTAAGRVGIFSARDDRNLTTDFRSARLFTYLQARDTDADELLFRDEFDRQNPLESLLVSEVAPFTGRALTSDCFNDFWGTATSGLNGGLPVGPTVAAATQIEVEDADIAVGTTNVHVFQKFADDYYAQDREAEVAFDGTGTAGTRSFSWLLRHQISSPSTGVFTVRGYFVQFHRDDVAGTSRVRVSRKLSQSAPTVVIAEYTSPGLGTGTSYDLRARVYSVTGPQVGTNDTPAIEAYIDSVQVPLVVPAGAPVGISANGSGTVFDETTDRITSGTCEGFTVIQSPPSTRPIFIGAFDQGVGGGTGTTALPEYDMASITLGSQTDGATGTLTIPAAWPVREEIKWPQRAHRFETDQEYRNVAGHRSRRRWTIEAPAEDVAHLATLRAFFTSHNGTEIPFNWTTSPPRSESVVVHFDEPSLFSGLVGPGVATYRFTLEEAY